eukprot:9653162-Prorocentrum_lima.AAC.1
MTSSLVGSEMCIRDSLCSVGKADLNSLSGVQRGSGSARSTCSGCIGLSCLLYTSDAADDM